MSKERRALIEEKSSMYQNVFLGEYLVLKRK